MRTIDWIYTDNKDTSWLVKSFKSENLIVDNSFQRRYVWLPKHQIKLIETILLGYAIPEIYVWITDTDPNTGITNYSIIDGQQRIGAIVDYINGKYPLSSSFLDNKKCHFANKYFSDLCDDEKRLIWSYSFSIRFVKSNVAREDIVKLFLRLNSTDKSLNPQELRNAEFDGKFLKLANEISEFDFWKENEIFSYNDLRRMKDIEFISSILIFLRFGIESETSQKAINDAYDLFNINYEEYDTDKELFNKILLQLQKVMKSNTTKIMLRKSTHLYTFIIVTYSALLKYDGFSEDMVEKINTFFHNYSNDDDNPDKDRYKSLVLEGTQNKANRIERVRIINKIIGV